MYFLFSLYKDTLFTIRSFFLFIHFNFSKAGDFRFLSIYPIVFLFAVRFVVSQTIYENVCIGKMLWCIGRDGSC